jgi:hypothetical protein
VAEIFSLSVQAKESFRQNKGLLKQRIFFKNFILQAYLNNTKIK